MKIIKRANNTPFQYKKITMVIAVSQYVCLCNIRLYILQTKALTHFPRLNFKNGPDKSCQESKLERRGMDLSYQQ